MTKLIIPFITILILTACSDGGSGGGRYDDYQELPEEEAIVSPYDEGTGHDAGFQWAEENGIDDPTNCGGDSASFIEGCEEYANSVAAYPADQAEMEEIGEEMPWADGR